MTRHDVVAAVLCRASKVLLCHRSPSRRWYPDLWDLPGGHVEDGERPEDALRRELLEEVGVDVGTVSGSPALRLVHDSTDFDLSIWVITSWTGVVENRQPNEHDQIAWFGRYDLPADKLADPAYLTFLQQLLER